MMHSFRYDDLACVKNGDIVTLEKSENNHLFKILRAAEGDEIRLLDGKGKSAVARVEKSRTLVITLVQDIPPLPGAKLHLFLAPPRRQKTDQILKQCTELGVASITPLICERSVSLPEKDSVEGRWNELLFEACKQSGNPYLPLLSPPVPFAEGVKKSCDLCEKSFYGSVVAEETSSAENAGAENVAWFVGPEGGFTVEEEEYMRNAGFLPLHMQCWILRAETAAICGLALLRERFSRK
ncbi:MAG: 16S rRNA (uracil(1498)-N(3))-methyltransferase [Lentisphaeria bacterium]|nr:16S rRNA (uracil(1498)-N(3))-methyltransferase [Lentisphaeria bacterium]